MCGLIGFFGATARQDGADAQGLLARMSGAIEHRGPDSEGSWFDLAQGVGLAHRRLAIVDVSLAGAQPMASSSGRYVITFNGEVYNHAALRTELGRLGAGLPLAVTANIWRGHSDTETLLAGFDAWGIEATVGKSIGMFAFAVWDKQNKTLTLGRDRLGEKPLYYGWQGQGHDAVFLFGSELKALRAHPAFAAVICPQALGSFLQNMAVGGTQTIYKGIHKVPPGTLLTISRQNPEPVVQRYWSLQDVAVQGVAQPFNGSATQAVDALEDLLKNAVSQQMMADVPLGAFLSGGVDSSTVVALMQAQSTRRVKTFSIGFEEDAYNEAQYAKAVAAHLGTDHTDLYVTPQQAMDVIPRLPTLYDEPFADSSQIPTFLVSQMTKQHVTVALSGDAGDELFAGYNRYQLTASLWPKLSRMPQSLRQVAGWSLTRFAPENLNRWASRLPMSERWASVGDKLHKGARVMSAGSVDDLYRGMVAMGWPDPTEVVKGLPDYNSPMQMPEMPGLSDVERMMALDALNYLPDDILTKVDRAAMGVSLETRVPFLDHRVVEFAWRLPMEYKLRPEDGALVTKWALRQVLYRHVPKALIERPKVGFGVPLEHWLRGPLRDWAEDLLSEERIKRDGYLHPAPIRQKWAEHLSGHCNNNSALWCVLMFQAWLAEQRVV
jgi:asparagine synthase (glutamine-hydrolysing)